jgi:MFS family permease
MASGLTLMPAAILMATVNPLAGIVFDKFGPRALVITGLCLTLASTLFMAHIDGQTSLHYITLMYTFRMGGFAMINMPLTAWGMNALPNELIAHGNAMMNTARQLAASIGIAILVSVMTVSADSHPAGGTQALSHGIDMAFLVAAIPTFIALIFGFVQFSRRKAQ